MILALLPLLVLAAPDRPLAREGEALTVRRYWTVETDLHGAVRPKWRNRRGEVLAWTWPDGVAERYQRFDGRTLVEDHRLDAAGRPLTTTTWAEDAPATVTVHGLDPVEVDVSGWTEIAVGPAVLRLPVEGVSDTPVEVRLDQALVRVDWTEATGGDPASDAFAQALRARCGCALVDRRHSWIGDVPGVRYRVLVPDPRGDHEGLIWLVPHQAGVLTLAATVPGATLPEVETRLAPARAAAALVRWTEDPP